MFYNKSENSYVELYLNLSEIFQAASFRNHRASFTQSCILVRTLTSALAGSLKHTVFVTKNNFLLLFAYRKFERFNCLNTTWKHSIND